MQSKDALKEIRLVDGTLPSHFFPGGYPAYYLDEQGNVLCPKCANKAGYSTNPYAYGVNYEDRDLYCDDCGGQIEPAYPADDPAPEPEPTKPEGSR